MKNLAPCGTYTDKFVVECANEKEAIIFISMLKYTLDEDIGHAICETRKLLHEKTRPPEVACTANNVWSIDELITLLHKAIKYKSEMVVIKAYKELIKQKMTYELANYYLAHFDIDDYKFSAKFKLINLAVDFLAKEMCDIRKLYCDIATNSMPRKQQFMQLPIKVIIKWLQYDKLIIDTENSVFYILMMWMLLGENRLQRIECAKDILCHVRFDLMRKDYLLDVVSFINSELPEDVFKHLPCIAMQHWCQCLRRIKNST